MKESGNPDARPGCDTWEEYPGQTWGEFAKNSECPIHGEDR